jgi:hypothetical protein
VVGALNNGDESGIEAVGNGWYRCWIVFTTGTLTTPHLLAAPASADDTTNFLGVNGDESIYIWHQQLELVSGQQSYAVSAEYLETTTATVSDTYATNRTGGSLTGMKGLLVEEARTNLHLHSERIASINYTKQRSSTQDDGYPAPDGGIAWSFLEDATNNSHYLFLTTGTVTTAQQYSASVYVKALPAGNRWATFVTWNSTTSWESATVDLSTGLVTATTSSASSLFTGTIQVDVFDEGNGWYRISRIAVYPNTTVYHYVATGDSATPTLDANGFPTYQGSVASDFGFQAWGFQLEVGPYTTSYIPATTVAVARQPEDIFTTDIGFFNQAEGTWFAEFEYPVWQVGSTVISMALNSSNRQLLYTGATIGDLDWYFNNGGAGQVNIEGAGGRFSSREVVRAAAVYSTNYATLFSSGVDVGQDLACTPSENLTRLTLGHAYSTADWYMNTHIRRISYWDEVLSDEILLGLSGARQAAIGFNRFGKMGLAQ